MDNDTLESTANEALKGMIEASTNASNWVLSEIPEVLEQLLLWRLTESLAFFSLGLIMFLTAVGAIMLMIAKLKRDGDEWLCKEWTIVPTVIIVLLLILSPIVVLENLDWLQIWLAPKVYLIEYAAQMFK